MSIESIQEKLMGTNIAQFVGSNNWDNVDGKLHYEDKYGIEWVKKDVDLVTATFGSTKCGVLNILSLNIENEIIKSLDLTYHTSSSVGTTRAPSLQVQENDIIIIEDFLDRYLNN